MNTSKQVHAAWLFVQEHYHMCNLHAWYAEGEKRQGLLADATSLLWFTRQASSRFNQMHQAANYGHYQQ